MKLQKIVLLLVLPVSLFVSVGCQTAARSAPNWRPPARVDFVNYVPGSIIRVRDNYNNFWTESVPYGESVYVRITIGMVDYSIADATVEVVKNGKTEVFPFHKTWSQSSGGTFYTNVLVQAPQNSPVTLTSNSNSW